MTTVVACNLADAVNLLSIASAGNLRHPGTSLLTIGPNSHLDQFMVFEGGFDLGKHVFAQAFFAHHDHRVQLVGQPPQETYLSVIQCHVVIIAQRAQILSFNDDGPKLMARSKSSKRWLEAHFDDPYVKKAQHEGLRSRAVFKLSELDEKYRLIRPGHIVVDLGAAPGGWSEYAAPRVKPGGRVVALDILEMEPLADVDFIQGDFTEQPALDDLETLLAHEKVDLVMSDMAPNMSGVAVSDQARAMYLAELAIEFAKDHLKPGGDLLVKMFQGEGFDAFVKDSRTAFSKVLIKKPNASRPKSREVYLLARSRLVE